MITTKDINIAIAKLPRWIDVYEKPTQCIHCGQYPFDKYSKNDGKPEVKTAHLNVYWNGGWWIISYSVDGWNSVSVRHGDILKAVDLMKQKEAIKNTTDNEISYRIKQTKERFLIP